ncbi:PREDICTED: neurotrypsin-like [Amphimedon queenslandica]|uniref:SRCR domain-containing protein n=1 Tax=Amphimedon queenslandica TaxID=400682 RepID=A0AAN0J7B3_AMPQE|nr:PREDICTED: neurotrypsin-like [Amphimedon queenslandica]|eukprot:XP_019852588.1 PREDICTED: neurotrypsin-like [Amphimedon queenslandica]
MLCAHYRSNAYYGQGNGSIVLDDVRCDGTEALLILQCSHSNLLTHNCGHHDDVGVVCPSTHNCTHGSIRLVEGSSISSGRLEICIDNEWGTVCDNGWTNINAQVVCKQLGQNRLTLYQGGFFLSDASYDKGSGRIFLDNVQCTGAEDTLIHCSYSSVESSCEHHDDVSVFCFSEIRSPGTVILSRNNLELTTYSSGVVRVYYSRSWGNICDDSFYGSAEANVICHQLGYTGASSYSRAGLTAYGTDQLPVMWDQVSCSDSNYLSIAQCSYSIATTNSNSACVNSNSNDATVSCYTTRIWNAPFPGMIRLQGATFSSQGRVEIYCNGEWGTLCNAGFDSLSASTLCRQLGYDNYYIYNHLELTGSPNQPIWSLDIVSSISGTCFNSSNTCPTTSISNCTHLRDVTLQCRDSDSSTKLTVTTETCHNTSSSNSQAPWAIIGGIISGIVVLIVIIAIIMCVLILRYRRSRSVKNRISLATAVSYSNTHDESSCQEYSKQPQAPPPANPYHQEQIPTMPLSQPHSASQYNFPLQDFTPLEPYPQQVQLGYPQQVQLGYPQQLQSNSPYPLAFPS